MDVKTSFHAYWVLKVKSNNLKIKSINYNLGNPSQGFPNEFTQYKGESEPITILSELHVNEACSF